MESSVPSRNGNITVSASLVHHRENRCRRTTTSVRKAKHETSASPNLELGTNPEGHAGFDGASDCECIDGRVTSWSEV